jgi:SAM-dependent methyltransferase
MSNDLLAASYDLVYADDQIKFVDFLTRFPQHRNEALVKLAGQGSRLLEIGCGDGNVLYNLRNQFSELHGVEISPIRANKLSETAKSRNLNLKVITGNIETGLEFPDGYFDVILWADVIEHVVDVWAAMAEIRRLLAPQGRLVTVTPNIAAWRYRLTLLGGRFPSTSGTNEGLQVRPGELFDGGHLHYFTFSSLQNLYRKYDIQPTQTLGFGKLGRLHNLQPKLLSGAVCVAGVKQS